ncbi:hypothetical protein CASFOL_003985 [Castilleja foliolosa]|uniref:Uncharacterized protein n=1 Tax=Castilleja foliolosa TaxID=1961234 RepID=A0ABD3EML4_9LAMI
MDYGGAHNGHLKAKPANSKQKHVKFKFQHGSAENQDSPDTISSSSSDSFSDDYFQVNHKILPKFRVQNNSKPPLSTGPPKSLFYENDNIDLSSEALYRIEESINGGSPGSTSRFSDITHESLMPQFSPTQSPPMQLMDKTGGFDPTRIPPSVFSKCSTPTEWSAASNDSLFSIRIGDGSFSRDRVSCEVLKPKELSERRSVEGELIRFGPIPSPTFKGIEPYFDIEETISANPEEIRILDERMDDGPMKGSVNKNHIDMVKSEICVQHFVKPKRNLLACVNGRAALLNGVFGRAALEFTQAAVASVQNYRVAAVSVRIGRVAAVSVRIGRVAAVSVRIGRVAAVSVRIGRVAAVSVRIGRAAVVSARLGHVASVLPGRVVSVLPGRALSVRRGRVVSAHLARVLSAHLGLGVSANARIVRGLVVIVGTRNEKRLLMILQPFRQMREQRIQKAPQRHHRTKERAHAFRVRLHILAVHAGLAHAAVD